MNHATIERLLEQAKQTQQQLESQLGGAARKNAQWRTVDADRRQLVRRLNAVKAVEAIDAGLKANKEAADE
ncbi:MAG: hypothetical protein KDA90_12340 [Planctomycetaceae bacterium]|nr:hypothetical protein [Planctomycetaceae bacterium]